MEETLIIISTTLYYDIHTATTIISIQYISTNTTHTCVLCEILWILLNFACSYLLLYSQSRISEDRALQ
jgi:hypothetical protein